MKNIIKALLAAFVVAVALSSAPASATTPCSFFPCGSLPYGGIAAPQPLAGISMGLLPYGFVADGQSNSFATGTVYYVPFPVFQTTTFAGSQILDSGAGNAGKHARTAVYAQSATGGPGALLKDFGIVALSGTPGLHQAANSVTITGPQMCYLAIVFDGSTTMATIGVLEEASAVGFYPLSIISSMLGDIGGNFPSGRTSQLGWTATQVYGAFSGTATAPSANFITTAVSGPTVAGFPAIELYY